MSLWPMSFCNMCVGDARVSGVVPSDWPWGKSRHPEADRGAVRSWGTHRWAQTGQPGVECLLFCRIVHSAFEWAGEEWWWGSKWPWGKERIASLGQEIQAEAITWTKYRSLRHWGAFRNVKADVLVITMNDLRHHWHWKSKGQDGECPVLCWTVPLYQLSSPECSGVPCI